MKSNYTYVSEKEERIGEGGLKFLLYVTFFHLKDLKKNFDMPKLIY